MRRTLRSAAVVLALVSGLVAASIGSATSQAPPYVINVTKVVDGDGPTGPFAVNITCTNPSTTPAGPFDTTIDDGATQTFNVNFEDVCTVTETDDLEADAVTYACTAEEDATCVDDQTAAMNDTFFDSGSATITITNTFEADVIDDVDPPADDVVPATPPFTG